jgi:hypothetical protein
VILIATFWKSLLSGEFVFHWANGTVGSTATSIDVCHFLRLS